ncbi:MAG: sensor domain-containing diguanylate cyclase [Lachnospiraceae bacterium]|nr:sensor domain-containing diguanylate cyclase [Lachnospiraceae bacterium]
MDFQTFLDKFECKACIMSVDIYPDGTYGNIRVVAGNKAHADDILMITGHPFVDGSPYEMCFPKDLNFEDFCYRSAIAHKQLHTYVNLYQMGLWLEIYMLPLESDKEGTGYCAYAYNVSPNADASIMSDLSPELLSSVLSTCIKLRGAKDFRESMNEVIRDIRDICEARRCCILLIDDEEQSCGILSDALRPGVEKPMGQSMNKSFYSVACTWEATLAGSTCLIIKNEHDMNVVKERNPGWYESLKKAEVQSLVLYPLKNNGKMIGYIWASNFNIERSDKIKEVLELTTFFIASEIANYQLLNRLEILSNMDLLTGCRNRNAMNNRVAEFDLPEARKYKNLAIVFVDLNGLKQTNDREGHPAGDRLLKRAANVLTEVFSEEEIYRAGGDEFMIIALNTSLKEMEDKIATLRNVSEDNNVSFAVGLCFDDTKLDIRKDMHIADERMYDDKDEYYEAHPERKYR